MEFKGTRGKLHSEFYKEDLYVNIVTENGSSVAGISTTDDQFEEAMYYGKLLSKAPEMLEMLKILIQDIEEEGNYSRQTGYDLEEAKKLIKSATII